MKKLIPVFCSDYTLVYLSQQEGCCRFLCYILTAGVTWLDVVGSFWQTAQICSVLRTSVCSELTHLVMPDGVCSGSLFASDVGQICSAVVFADLGQPVDQISSVLRHIYWESSELNTGPSMYIFLSVCWPACGSFLYLSLYLLGIC